MVEPEKVKLLNNLKRQRSVEPSTVLSEASLKRTESESGSSQVVSPSSRPLVCRKKAPKLIMVGSDEGSSALVTGLSSVELSDQPVGELVNRRRPFPEGAEVIAAKFTSLTEVLMKEASDLSTFLNEGIGRFTEVSQVQQELENKKVGLTN